MVLAGIRRLVVQIKAIERDDLRAGGAATGPARTWRGRTRGSSPRPPRSSSPPSTCTDDPKSIAEQPLRRNVQQFRDGLVSKAHTLCVSLNSMLESNEEAEETYHHAPQQPAVAALVDRPRDPLDPVLLRVPATIIFKLNLSNH